MTWIRVGATTAPKVTTLAIELRAVTKGRPQFERGRAHTPKRTREFEEQVAWAARTVPPIPRDARLSVELSLFSKRKLTGDLDNYAKAILDGLQKGGLFENDGQIDVLQVARLGGPTDEILVTVTEL